MLKYLMLELYVGNGQQYEVNLNYLKEVDKDHITGYEYLERSYNIGYI